jgi:hypothetical protein
VKKTSKKSTKVEARTVTVKDEWGHERVVGGFGNVGSKKKPSKKIRNLKQLHAHVGSMSSDSTFEELAKGIAHRLYKDTSCGIGFHAPKGGKSVIVSGYCEGTDAECQSRELVFPFTPEEFDAEVEAADQDGIDLWNETHGCERCGMGGVVNPDCKGCGGEGVII